MPLFKLPFTLLIVCLFEFTDCKAQQAPAHLQYFGFTAIDCFYNDPMDASPLDNYITEVDSFSNIAHMCVYDPGDSIIQRVNLMNQHCVNPVLHIQDLFFHAVDSNAPSGVNYDLYTDFNSRWNNFVSANSTVLSVQKIACFYVADEPAWNGIDSVSMDTVCALLKNTFPEIPLLMIEAYTTVSVMVVPEQMNWVGFDRYGSYDPENDPDFQNDLDTLKSKLSSPDQRIFLIIDDQWFPDYQTYLGWTQDTMAEVVQNYYDLAVSDTLICGMIGYIWPGGLDAPDQYGVRNMNAVVKAKNVEIGQKIKANYSPCGSLSLPDENESLLMIYPNPFQTYVTVNFSSGDITPFQLTNITGEIITSGTIESGEKIDCSMLAKGTYLLKLHGQIQRLIKN